MAACVLEDGAKQAEIVAPTLVVFALPSKNGLVDASGAPVVERLLERDLKHLHADRDRGFISVHLPKDRVLHAVVRRLVVTLPDVHYACRAKRGEEGFR